MAAALELAYEQWQLVSQKGCPHTYLLEDSRQGTLCALKFAGTPTEDTDTARLIVAAPFLRALLEMCCVELHPAKESTPFFEDLLMGLQLCGSAFYEEYKNKK